MRVDRRNDEKSLVILKSFIGFEGMMDAFVTRRARALIEQDTKVARVEIFCFLASYNTSTGFPLLGVIRLCRLTPTPKAAPPHTASTQSSNTSPTSSLASSLSLFLTNAPLSSLHYSPLSSPVRHYHRYLNMIHPLLSMYLSCLLQPQFATLSRDDSPL